jgi:acyl-CoA thioester hydrolase
MEQVGDEYEQMYVVDARATFRGSARFDDLLDLKVRVAAIGTTSHKLRIDICRDDAILTEVYVTYVRAVEGRPTPLSDAFRALIAPEGDFSAA